LHTELNKLQRWINPRVAISTQFIYSKIPSLNWKLTSLLRQGCNTDNWRLKSRQTLSFLLQRNFNWIDLFAHSTRLRACSESLQPATIPQKQQNAYGVGFCCAGVTLATLPLECVVLITVFSANRGEINKQSYCSLRNRSWWRIVSCCRCKHKRAIETKCISAANSSRRRVYLSLSLHVLRSGWQISLAERCM